MESMGAGIYVLFAVIAVFALVLVGLIVWAVRAARARSEHEETLRSGSLQPESGGGSIGAFVPPSQQGVAASSQHVPAPPTQAFAPAPEAQAATVFGPNDTVRVTPLGSDTELDYLRLAAEPVQPPPPTPLGRSNASKLFSWTAAVSERDLDETVEERLADDSAAQEVGGFGGEDLDRTVSVPRRAPAGSWELVLPDGSTIPLAQDNVIGRRPEAAPGAHPIVIPDPTRTLSKTHVRLRLSGEIWVVEDLGSTNGVVLVHDDGSEQQLEAHRPVVAARRMLFGTLPVLLRG